MPGKKNQLELYRNFMIIIISIITLSIGIVLGYLLSRRYLVQPAETSEINILIRSIYLITQERWKDAISLLETYYQTNPTKLEIYTAVGSLHRNLGNLRKATSIHTNIAHSTMADRDLKAVAHAELSLDYVARENWEKAFNAITEARDLALRNRDVLKKSYDLAVKLEYWNDAYLLARDLMKMDNSWDVALLRDLIYAQACYHLDNKEFSSAKSVLKLAKEMESSAPDLNGKLPWANVFMGDLYLLQNKDSKAIKEWSNVPLEHFSLVDERYKDLYMRNERDDLYRELLESIVAENPHDLRTRLSLGNYYRESGNLEMAAQTYQDGANVFPHTDIFDKLSILTLKKFDSEKAGELALKFFENEIQAHPAFACKKCQNQFHTAQFICPSCRSLNSLRRL